jgi:hypothetical protein
MSDTVSPRDADEAMQAILTSLSQSPDMALATWSSLPIPLQHATASRIAHGSERLIRNTLRGGVPISPKKMSAFILLLLSAILPVLGLPSMSGFLNSVTDMLGGKVTEPAEVVHARLTEARVQREAEERKAELARYQSELFASRGPLFSTQNSLVYRGDSKASPRNFAVSSQQLLERVKEIQPNVRVSELEIRHVLEEEGSGVLMHVEGDKFHVTSGAVPGSGDEIWARVDDLSPSLFRVVGHFKSGDVLLERSDGRAVDFAEVARAPISFSRISMINPRMQTPHSLDDMENLLTAAMRELEVERSSDNSRFLGELNRVVLPFLFKSDMNPVAARMRMPSFTAVPMPIVGHEMTSSGRMGARHTVLDGRDTITSLVLAIQRIAQTPLTQTQLGSLRIPCLRVTGMTHADYNLAIEARAQNSLHAVASALRPLSLTKSEYATLNPWWNTVQEDVSSEFRRAFTHAGLALPDGVSNRELLASAMGPLMSEGVSLTVHDELASPYFRRVHSAWNPDMPSHRPLLLTKFSRTSESRRRSGALVIGMSHEELEKMSSLESRLMEWGGEGDSAATLQVIPRLYTSEISECSMRTVLVARELLPSAAAVRPFERSSCQSASIALLQWDDKMLDMTHVTSHTMSDDLSKFNYRFLDFYKSNARSTPFPVESAADIFSVDRISALMNAHARAHAELVNSQQLPTAPNYIMTEPRPNEFVPHLFDVRFMSQISGEVEWYVLKQVALSVLRPIYDMMMLMDHQYTKRIRFSGETSESDFWDTFCDAVRDGYQRNVLIRQAANTFLATLDSDISILMPDEVLNPVDFLARALADILRDMYNVRIVGRDSQEVKAPALLMLAGGAGGDNVIIALAERMQPAVEILRELVENATYWNAMFARLDAIQQADWYRAAGGRVALEDRASNEDDERVLISRLAGPEALQEIVGVYIACGINLSPAMNQMFRSAVRVATRGDDNLAGVIIRAVERAADAASGLSGVNTRVAEDDRLPAAAAAAAGAEVREDALAVRGGYKRPPHPIRMPQKPRITLSGGRAW